MNAHKKMNKYILINGKILTPFEILNDFILEITDGKISDISERKSFFIKQYKRMYKNSRIIDLKGKIISPGFIDIHNHGANRISFLNMGGDINDATEFLIKYGVTSFLITIGHPPFETILSNIKKIKRIINSGYRGSRIFGINLEGPYLNPKYGAQREDVLKPIKKEYSTIFKEGLDYIKIMTVAPEIEGGKELIEYLNESNIITSIGHSEASISDINFAILNGAKLITHIFNAFGSPIQLKDGIKPIGIDEYLLTREDLYAEVVVDKNGIHVDPLFLKILLNIKGKDKIILITDSIETAGLRPGEYKSSDSIKLIVKDDININKDNNDTYGSAMTLNKSIKNMISHTGIDIKDAVLMATYNPAKLLGINNYKGSIKVGMDADIVIIDDDINVYMSIIKGDIIFNNLTH